MIWLTATEQTKENEDFVQICGGTSAKLSLQEITNTATGSVVK